MRYLAIVGLLAVLAAPGLAQPLANPWADCTDIGFNITIPPMIELWSTIGTNQQRNSAPAVALTVTNAGGTIPAGGKAEDAIAYLGNTVPIDVSVQLDGDIPVWTRFHVIIAPTNRPLYNSVFAGLAGQVDVVVDAGMGKVITWDRRDTGHVGNVLSTPYAAFSGIASAASQSVDVDYAVDAIHGMPANGAVATPTVLWTLAVTP